LVSEFIAKISLLEEVGRDDARHQAAPPLIPGKVEGGRGDERARGAPFRRYLKKQ
jgi:hypothetical protein